MPTALQELALLARGAQVANPVGSFLQGQQAATQLQQQGAAFNQQSALNDLRLRTGEAALTQSQADLLRAAELRRALGAAVNGSPTGLADLARLGEDGLAAASSLQNLQSSRNAEARAQAAEGRAVRGEQRQAQRDATDDLFRAESLNLDQQQFGMAREKLDLAIAAGDRAERQFQFQVAEADRKAAQGRPPTEGMLRSRRFLSLMRGSEAAIASMVGEGFSESGLFPGARAVQSIFGSDQVRAYNSFADNWVEQMLRASTGAAARPDEQVRLRDTYFPTSRDDEEAQRAKANLRRNADIATEIQAGLRDFDSNKVFNPYTGKFEVDFEEPTSSDGVLKYNPSTGEFE
ncbi:MAG: hypothetical protein AAFN78_01005 [Pseudomonadota bacterium]